MKIAGICPFCGLAYAEDIMTTCNECGTVFCGHCAQTITSDDDVVCPPCFTEAMFDSDEDEESA